MTFEFVLTTTVIATGTRVFWPVLEPTNPNTTVAVGSNGASLPTGTINVISTGGFASSGAISIVSSAGVQTVFYTGTSGGNQFTGCTGGAGTLATGNAVGSNPDPGAVFSGYSPPALNLPSIVDYVIEIPISGSGGVVPPGIAGGDLSGTFPNPHVVGLQGRPLAVSPAPLATQVLTWNGSAWVPAAGGSGGSVGGDLSGSLPNPSVIKLQGNPVAVTTPTVNQVLTWDGSEWTPEAGGTGGPAGGDLSGTLPNPTVVKIQTIPVSVTAPTEGEALVAVGGTYKPTGFFFSVKNYGAAGNGIQDDRSSFAAAIAAIGSSGTLYLPAGTYRIGSNLTIANTIRIKFEEGAIIKPDSSVVVSLSTIDALGNQQIFDATAGGVFQVTSPGPNTIYAPWFGAKGDGSHDDTAAIQAALNLFTGRSSSNSGEIFFPTGTYKITSALTFTGNVSISLRLRGQCTGVQAGTIIRWGGAAHGTMMNTYGLCTSEFQDLLFDGGSIGSRASVGVWLHTDQPGGGAGSNGVFFRKCFFNNFEGTGAFADSACVNIGDIGSTQEVQAIYFHDCTFTGDETSYPAHVPFALVQSLQNSQGNTEIFHFTECVLQAAQYGYFSLASNNGLSFLKCQFGLCCQAAIFGGGFCELLVEECQVENNNSVAKNGFFIAGAGFARVIDCEIIMDCLNQNTLVVPAAYVSAGVPQWSGVLSGTMIQMSGIIENCLLDATGEIDTSVQTTILVSNPAPLSSGTTILHIRGCFLPNSSVTGQIRVMDSSGNNLTQSYVGQTYRTSIWLFDNHTIGAGAHGLPNFLGTPPTIPELAPLFRQDLLGTPFFMKAPLYAGEVHTVTTCYEILFSDPVFAQATVAPAPSLAQLQQRTIITKIFVEVITPFKGGSLTSSTLKIGSDVIADRYIQSFDCWTGAVNVGLANSDLGSGLARATAVQGGDPVLWSSGSNFIVATFSFSGNVGNGSVTNLTGGRARVYITTEQVTYQ